MHYYNKEKKLFWPINVIYGGKKFYCMTPNNQKLNVNKNTLLYYCNRHRKVSRKNENIKCCNVNIIYVRNEDSFYFKKDHSRECNDLDGIEPENFAELDKETYKFSQFKNILLN